MIHDLKKWSTFNSIHFGTGGSLDVQKAKQAFVHLKDLQESKDSKIRRAEAKKQEL